MEIMENYAEMKMLWAQECLTHLEQQCEDAPIIKKRI